MNYDIGYQSDGILELSDVLADGSLLVHNMSHEKELVVRISDSMSDIDRYVRMGWGLLPGRDVYILRSPEGSLADLSEFHHNPVRSLPEILAYYRTLKGMEPDILQRHINDSVRRLDYNCLANRIFGNSMESEIRVTCSSIHSLSKLPNELYSEITRQYKEEWQEELAACSSGLKDRNVGIKKGDISDSGVLDIHSGWKKRYESLGFQNFPNTDAIYGIWSQLTRLDFDKYFFVMGHGVKYALGFLMDGGDADKICLVDAHLGIDFRKLMFFRDLDEMGEEKCALVDKVYSGNTFEYLSERMSDSDVTKIGMFPKSRSALSKTDYVLFLDRLLESSDVPMTDGWCEDTFKKVSSMGANG